MIYFKSDSGEVFAFESIEDREQFGPAGLTQMSETDVHAHLNPPPKQLTRGEVSELRRLAYADLLNGSDPLYIEYQRAIAMGEPDQQVESAKSAWLNRASEIALQYPWPADS